MPGNWSVDWTLESTSNSKGKFISSLGAQVDTILDAQQVVYLPPRDLMCDGEQTIYIKARIYDIGSAADLRDADMNVRFVVLIRRPGTAGALFSISITKEDFTYPTETVPPCTAMPGGCCTLVGKGYDAGGAVAATLDPVPSALLVNEIRAFVIHGGDTDIVHFECGLAPNCPSVLNGGDLDDTISCTWTVLNPPASGMGPSFLGQGKTVIFKSGEVPGNYEIKVTVNDAPVGYDDTPPLELPPFKVLVCKLDFIDQGNNILPKLDSITEHNEGLRISQRITDDGTMNVQDPNGPTFAGPPGPSEPRT
ncbi:MAG: hypothetical protein IPK67_15155 [Planctomycetes bacterium]|nr:hypothetical protein [Planctomycetota bacterium]